MAGGGGGRELSDSDLKNLYNLCSYHFIEIIFDSIIHTTKNEFGNFFILGGKDVTKLPLSRREQVVQFGYLPPENEFNLKNKISFYVQNRSFRPKLVLPVNFSNFQAEKNFFILKLFALRLDEKRVAATPLVT